MWGKPNEEGLEAEDRRAFSFALTHRLGLFSLYNEKSLTRQTMAILK